MAQTHASQASSEPNPGADPESKSTATSGSASEPTSGAVNTSSQYPPPPIFYKSYAPGGHVPVHEAAVSREPPRIPADSFQCFGDEWKVVEPNRSLKDEGRAELFTPSKDLDLRATIRSLLRKTVKIYADLLKVVADPEEAKEAERLAKEMEDHYVNILFLINQFRPHQAREILLHQLQEQVDKQKRSAKNLNELVSDGRKRIGAVAEKIQNQNQNQIAGAEGDDAMEVEAEVGVKDKDVAGSLTEVEWKEGREEEQDGEDIDTFMKTMEGLQ